MQSQRTEFGAGRWSFRFSEPRRTWGRDRAASLEARMVHPRVNINLLLSSLPKDTLSWLHDTGWMGWGSRSLKIFCCWPGLPDIKGTCLLSSQVGERVVG
jgi:hypothetical protein